MDTLVCPKGHPSSEPDYCSECGAKMSGSAGASNGSVSGAASGTGQICPDCKTPREDAGIAFCEICGYNFVSGAHGEVPLTPQAAPPVASAVAASSGSSASMAPSAPVAAATASNSATAAKWTVLLSVDPSLREAGSPEPPANVGPFTFELTKDVTLIGRRSEARAIFPEIPMFFDDAVSHRHALLELTPEGALMVRDIGSSNGTRLNGKELPAMVDTPLKDGDQLTLGHWSRIAIKAGA